MRAIRASTGRSQSKFAELLSIEVSTLRNWEQGRRDPSGPAMRAWMNVIGQSLQGQFFLEFLIEDPATGWLVTRQRFVDDEVPGWSSTAHCDDVLEVAGTEVPVSLHLTGDGGSPRG